MYRSYFKQLLDVLLAFIAIILCAIPILIIAISITIDTRGPVLFKQLRYGKNKYPFYVYKFRTMATEAPIDMPTNIFKDSGVYITRVGKVLRKLSIDELPQIINVLKGDMSLVGPRPVVLAETQLIRQRAKYHANSVKPGITGLAQVNGRDELDYLQKAEMDGQYVKNIRFMTDMKCILKTFYVTFSFRGHAEGHEQQDTASDEDREIA